MVLLLGGSTALWLLLARRLLRLPPARLRPAFVQLLEWIGLTLAFYAADVVFGMTLTVLLRATGYFVSMYLSTDVSLLGVVNTLAMSVAERTREIGLLRALGASRWLVRLSMLDESLLITLSGAIAGIGLGLLIAWTWVQSLGDFMPGISFHLPVTAIIGIAVAAVVLGSLAAALPARRAARLNVIDALSYE